MDFSTKKFYFTIVILSLAIIGLIFLNVTSQKSLIDSQNFEVCNTLEFNDENAINIVFFSPEKSAREYSEYLVSAEPFQEHEKDFNFFYIDSYSPECELYRGIAIYCHSKNLIKKAASCPHDYIVVLDEMDAKIRSSAYQNVMSINTKHPKSVFLHEFGHSFANLAEEYTPAKIPRGSENCQKSCDKFEGEGSCFKGCSNTNYYRSIENGVMRTLSTDDYGIYNDNLISELIEKSVPKDLQITGAAVSEFSNSCKNKYFSIVETAYNGEKFTQIGQAELTAGCSPNPSHLLAGPYQLDNGTHFNTLIFTIANDSRAIFEGNSTLLVIPGAKASPTFIRDSITHEYVGEITTLPSQGGNILCKVE